VMNLYNTVLLKQIYCCEFAFNWDLIVIVYQYVLQF
jgi:hypothetical protein